MDGVGPFQSPDAEATTDRRTHYYSDVVSLAKQILRATGRTLDEGLTRSWTFLIRTPTPVETGIRAIVTDQLSPVAQVQKGQLGLAGTNMTINPDLVVTSQDDQAVGDIKYKLAGDDWERPDLYEVVAFAAGYQVQQAVLTNFVTSPRGSRRPVTVGQHRVTQVGWPAENWLDPEGAADAFCRAVKGWWEGIN
jgi:hypothetical protein